LIFQYTAKQFFSWWKGQKNPKLTGAPQEQNARVLQQRPEVSHGPNGDEDQARKNFCQDARITRNTTAGWQHVRAIRVLAGKGLTTRSSHSYIVHAGSEAIELGTVPLAPDGSFFVEVPADTPIALQAVDAEGRSELNEMSWIYVRPGEKRGCVGCHHPRQAAPRNERPFPLAMRVAPLKLLGQGRPHRFRGNNAAVTGLMEMQFDRYREVAGINRHADTADPLATGAQEVTALIANLEGGDERLRISSAATMRMLTSRFRASVTAPMARRTQAAITSACGIPSSSQAS